jgi:hypothetical protein
VSDRKEIERMEHLPDSDNRDFPTSNRTAIRAMCTLEERPHLHATKNRRIELLVVHHDWTVGRIKSGKKTGRCEWFASDGDGVAYGEMSRLSEILQ